MDNHEVIDRAIRVAGGYAHLARKLGVKLQTVCAWRSRGQVPADRCPTIERITDGRVRCEDLRPDVEWYVLRRRHSPSARQAARQATAG